ncbi:MAG: hypothetical protein WCP96_05360 [Methylococcaceae bacterium]
MFKTWGVWGDSPLALMGRGLSAPHVGLKNGESPHKFTGSWGFYAIYGHKYQFLTACQRLFYCFHLPIFLGNSPKNKNHLGSMKATVYKGYTTISPNSPRKYIYRLLVFCFLVGLFAFKNRHCFQNEAQRLIQPAALVQLLNGVCVGARVIKTKKPT